MREVKETITYNGVDYPLVFNLNVIEIIQEEYGTFEAWGDLTDGKSGEVNIKALRFGFCAMINEGIEIENEETGEKRELITEKQAGRIITGVGMSEAKDKITSVVVDSSKDPAEDQKNA